MKSGNKTGKLIASILRTLRLNKERITDISIGWKNKDKEEPKVLVYDVGHNIKERVEYLKIELYLKCPLKED